MSEINPCTLWAFLEKFYQSDEKDLTSLLVACDYLGEHGDSRGENLRRRIKRQAALKAKVAVKYGDGYSQRTSCGLHNYVRDMFPECKTSYSLLMREKVDRTMRRLWGLLPSRQEQSHDTGEVSWSSK
jgi:hypothetical protein